MEVYILDSLLRRIEVIDRFESLIWTERWSSHGDFEMKIRSTYESRALLRNGTRLSMSTSLRVMVIDTVEDSILEDGTEVLQVSGPSIERIFIDRAVKEARTPLNDSPTWDLTDVPAAIMRKLVHDLCVTGVLSVYDKVPYLIEARHPSLPESSIAEPVDPISLKIEPQNLYEVLTNLGNTWTLGFRLLLLTDASQLYFDVYSGSDRTMSQVTRRPILFTPSLDNLQNMKELHTTENYKNVAYVFSPVGFQEVLPAGVEPTVDGFERRVLMVKADDVTEGDPSEIEAALIQKGREALAEHREFQAFDGEIDQNSQYKYNVDYFLGDLVEMRNKDGLGNQMRVTEQIFVSDREGERAYPTLTLNTFVSTGSWLSWETNKKWIDYEDDTETVWSVLP